MSKTKTTKAASTPKPEVLVSCPDCGRNNFTPRGLQAHKCNVQRSIKGLNALSDEEKQRALGPATPVALVPVKNAPTLTLWSDHEAATKVRQLVREAQDGLRRIIVCGLFLETLKMDLPHGQLGHWIETHCPDVTWRTANRWMSLAANIRKACEIKLDTVSNLKFPIYEAITLPPEDRPEEVRDVCARMDELMAGKSARQLLLEFKQAEEDEDGNLVARRGRLPGSKSNRRRKGIQEGLDETAAESVEFLTNLKGDLYLAATGDGITRIPRELLEGLLQNSVQLSTRIRELLKSH